jgi:oligopeptide/dipeptide ABC transporter ATP-binding protein
MSQLWLKDLQVSFPGNNRPAVAGLSLRLESGRVLALIGESGSGKTMTALSLLALLPDDASVSGALQIDDRFLSLTDATAIAGMRGRVVGLVFQDPMSSLNPVLTIGEQVDEVFRRHRQLDRSAARAATIALLTQLGMPEPAQRRAQYPHQFSGGQRQRIALAMAIAAQPAFLIADEPTTALDVTIQAQIMELLQRRVEDGMGLLLITHDIALAAENADDIAVIYGGRLVEYGPCHDLIEQPRHPYTALLLAASLNFTSDGPVAATTEIPPIGCAFAPRCPNVTARCQWDDPLIRDIGERRIACHHPLEMVAPAGKAVPS